MSAAEKLSTTLRGHSFISLTTFRKNGQGVPTPVTFAEYDGKVYVFTGLKSGKVKRLRNNPAVEIAPCDQVGNRLGETLPARARILSADEVRTLRRHMKFRSPAIIMAVFGLFQRLRSGGAAYLEISME
ncbi:MAG: PPOX class F420-dependent oxidoreductase [Chloroflexi bacterium]|nr:PPOX class F420-dependent oxidoreductase [Chloroflexota bacterium]